MSTIYFDKPLRLTEAQLTRAYNFIDVRLDANVNYGEIKGRTLVIHCSSNKGCKVTLERYFGKHSAEDEEILSFIVNGIKLEREEVK